MGMAPEGLGPSTPGFKVRCSAQLSYEAVKCKKGVYAPVRGASALMYIITNLPE